MLSGQTLEPSCRALELIGGTDVEHEVSVQDGDDVGGRDVLRQQLECLGLAPPLPPTKMLNPFSVAMRPKLGGKGAVLANSTLTHTTGR